MGVVIAVVAFGHIAACCVAATMATAVAGHLATCGKEHNLDLGSARQEAYHLVPSLVTCLVVDQGLVDGDAFGLA